MDKNKIVTIQTFDSQVEAQIVKGLLESAGINASLIHETIQSILPLQNEQTQIELCVAAEDEQQARDLLAAKYDKTEFSAAKSNEPKAKRGCNCGPKRK